MRRFDRQRDLAFSQTVMDRCSHGVMAISTGEATPYCLPLSFVRMEDKLYFHCASEGRKVDLLRQNPRVCITFVGRDQPAFEAPDSYTTYFQSALVTGTAVKVADEGEKAAALRALCQKLTPEHMDGPAFQRAVSRSLSATAVWRIDVDQVTGKEKRENL